jgi:hypothetical protein
MTNSTFSASLKYLNDIFPYHDNLVSEDNHVLLKGLFHIKEEGGVQLESVMLPVVGYAAQDSGIPPSLWKSLKARWWQARRHAMGVSELIYVLHNSATSFSSKFVIICSCASPILL